MTDKYVRSTDGNNADDGSTWALAKIDLWGAAAVDAFGDAIFVSDAHAESTSTSVTLAWAGTLARPTRVICGDDVAEPPTAVATTATATLATGATRSWTFTGCAYFYGITFINGEVSFGGTIFFTQGTAATEHQTFENCVFRLLGDGVNSAPFIGLSTNNNATSLTWLNCTFDPRNNTTSASKGIQLNKGTFRWLGGGLGGSSSAIVQLFHVVGTNGRQGDAIIDGVDLSPCASTLAIFPASGVGSCVIRNCKLPASWTGSLFVSAPTQANYRVEMYNCDDGDTNYKLWIEDYAGSIVDETTIVRTGGATESRKMVTSATDKYPQLPLRGPEISRYNSTVGSSVTVTLEFVHDSVTDLQNDEFWIDVQYLGTSGFPLSLFADSAVADVLATPADTTDSTETWEMGSPSALTNPNTRKCTVTFTPQEAGYIHVVPVLAIASTTVYYDPEITVA